MFDMQIATIKKREAEVVAAVALGSDD